MTYDNLLPDQGAVIEIWYIAKRKAEIYVNAQSMSGIDLKQLDYYGSRLLQPFVSLTSTIIFFLAVTYVTANLASEFRSRPTRISRSIFLLKRVSLALLIIWGIYTLYQVANARYIASNTPPSELFPWGAL